MIERLCKECGEELTDDEVLYCYDCLDDDEGGYCCSCGCDLDGCESCVGICDDCVKESDEWDEDEDFCS